MLRLVRHYASSLEDREWEVVFHILHSTQSHLTQAQQVQHHGANLQGRGNGLLSVRLCKAPHQLDSYRLHYKTSSPVLRSTGKEARTTLVLLTSSSNFWTTSETPYQLVGPLLVAQVRLCSLCLQVQSVLSLVHYTALITDSADQDWIQKLSDFMEKFYR